MTSTFVNALEGALRSSDSRPTAEVKAALTRLSAEIQQRIVRGSDSSLDFVQASVRALSRIKGRANAQLRITCLVDSGQYLFSHGRSLDAVLAGVHGEQLARLTGNSEALSKALTLQGMANVDLGNVSAAVVQCAQAVEIGTSQKPSRQASNLINLGIALNYAGLFQDAVPCFDRAIALMASTDAAMEARQLGQLGAEFARAALSNKSWSYFELGRIEEALGIIQQALLKCPEPWDALSAERRAIRECMVVQFATVAGNIELARQHAAVSRAHAHVSDRARFHGEFATALFEAAHQQDVRPKRLELLLRSCNSTVQRIDVLSALIRTYDQLGLADDALQCMHQLISLVRQQREKTLAAMLSIYANDASLVGRDNTSSLAAREAVLRAKVAERKLARDRVEMLERLAVTADLKEEQSGQHGYRVGRMSKLIAERLAWRADAAHGLESAARLHDIGKIAVPDRILLASDSLRSTEREIMSTHATAGGELLSNSNLPELRLAEEIARYHHEWWDGEGYPSKLSGKRIPIHARIVALSDVFDALTHGRPYAPAWSIDNALEEIKKRRGTQFDPDLTDTFLSLVEELRRKHTNLDTFLGEGSRNSRLLQAREKIRLMLGSEQQSEKIGVALAYTVH